MPESLLIRRNGARLTRVLAGLVLISVLFFPGCTDSGSVTASKTTRESARMAIDKGERTRLKAAQLGYEWTSIEPLLNSARKAMIKGNFEQAVNLASEAEKHAGLAISQADHERQHWQENVPKNER